MGAPLRMARASLAAAAALFGLLAGHCAVGPPTALTTQPAPAPHPSLVPQVAPPVARVPRIFRPRVSVGSAAPAAAGTRTGRLPAALAALAAGVGAAATAAAGLLAPGPHTPAGPPVPRRVCLTTAAAAAAAVAVAAPPPPAAAALITQFPPARLKNVYLLMRAGEGQFEAAGRVLTNPVRNTNVASGLTPAGRRQVINGLTALRGLRLDADRVWLWPAISSRSYETAELLAQGLGVPRARIVPEYGFLDARAFGSYEGRPVGDLEAVYAADRIDTSLRPPPYSDGTPNESVNDVFVRIVQLLSKLEAQYSGNVIVVVAPDSDTLSVLQAALTGYDMRLNHDLAYEPGEVRMVNLTGADPPAAD